MIQKSNRNRHVCDVLLEVANLPLIYRLIQGQDNKIQVLENDTLRDLVSIFDER